MTKIYRYKRNAKKARKKGESTVPFKHGWKNVKTK
jgi:hypothetical protein